MNGTAKLILTNIAVLLIGLLSLNFFFSLVIDGVYLYKKAFPSIAQPLYRESLPEQESAEKIFRELRQLIKRYTPYMGWSRQPFAGNTVNVEPIDGERVTPTTTTHPIKHVHFFGGSTMWGTGVDDYNTIPAHFNAQHPDYRVYNHGQSGFVSRQGLARLVNLVNQNSPMHIVIFYDGCNDPITLCRKDVSINGHREQAKISRKLTHRWHIPDNLLGSTRKALRTVFKKGKRPESRCEEDLTYAKTVATTMVNNWKIAKSVAALAGAEFHAILQPVARIGNPNTDYLQERFDGTEWHLVYPFVQEIKAQEHLTWIHDFTEAFDSPQPLYIDLCHVNSHGNEIIAKRLSEILQGSQPPSS